MPFRQLQQPEKWLNVTPSYILSHDLADAFLRVRDQFHTRETERNSGVVVILFLPKRVKPRQKLIDRERSAEHIDTDHCGALYGYSCDVTVLHLLIVRIWIVAPQARGSHFAYREEASTY